MNQHVNICRCKYVYVTYASDGLNPGCGLAYHNTSIFMVYQKNCEFEKNALFQLNDPSVLCILAFFSRRQYHLNFHS